MAKIFGILKVRRHSLVFCRFGCAPMALAATLSLAHSAEPAKPGTKSESFDRDPGWEGHNNRIVPKEFPTIINRFAASG